MMLSSYEYMSFIYDEFDVYEEVLNDDVLCVYAKFYNHENLNVTQHWDAFLGDPGLAEYPQENKSVRVLT